MYFRWFKGTLEQRFCNCILIDDSEKCWLWIGPTSNGRYGQFGRGSKPNEIRVKAHRFSWELFNGPIPEGMKVLHSCDNPPCVNPSHLFLGTQKDNAQDAIRKGRFYFNHGRR